ncbi:hypothetical protein GALMADRAFT_138644 [Galerina marginata CBS 339.88]|uniref:Uncharacterized protein n=1 Tax=Galerina marginata (strain CBS 339.88) TaxID=685588 RepID=A0A067TF03_GALM3|nr:hypothetical protein GALMADRAFT_138644 [Galerina marginata CBS 339.88]
MSLDHLHITTQFTEDCIATQASVCERPACSKPIQAGQQHFYFGPDENSNRPGRYICEPCMSYYLKKPSTTACVVPTRAVPISGTAPAGPRDNPSQPRHGGQSTVKLASRSSC